MPLDEWRLVTGFELFVDAFIQIFEVRFAEVVFLASHVSDLADLECFDPRFLEIIGFQKFFVLHYIDHLSSVILVFRNIKVTSEKPKEGMTVTCPKSLGYK